LRVTARRHIAGPHFFRGGENDEMADWDWMKVAVQGGVSLLSAGAGLLLGVWRAGKKSGKEDAEKEAKLKADIARETDAKIEGFKLEMRTAVADALDNNETFIKSVGDTFSALRQKINDVELESERRFLPKDDFNNFLKEYREDMRDLKDMIGKVTLRRQ
jgi:hypothetical protein